MSYTPDYKHIANFGLDTRSDFLLLRTKDIFIGDIDYIGCITKEIAIGALKNLQKDTNCGAIRIYETMNGLRFILVDRKVSLKKDELLAYKIFTRSLCDPMYSNLSFLYGGYTARVSTKPGRVELSVCKLVYDPYEGLEFDSPIREIQEFISLHDTLCLWP